LAAVFGAAGLNRLAADPWVNIALAMLFLLFGANLFDWFDLSLPWRVLTAADGAVRDAPRGSSLGALMMGATFTLTSVTCTAPFVGTLLVLAANGSWLSPVVGMVVYSTAFAFPFVLLALSPRLIARLPRSGEWIRTLRVLIGLLEIGAAIRFVANADLVLGWGILTREVVLGAWVTLAAIGAFYLGRRAFQRRKETPLTSLNPAIIALALAIWLATGLKGDSLNGVEAFLPPHVPMPVLRSAGVAP